MSLFQRKKEPQIITIKSEEYLELHKDLEKLRISFESIKLELDLYKKKLRISKKLDLEEDTDQPNINKVILPEK